MHYNLISKEISPNNVPFYYNIYVYNYSYNYNYWSYNQYMRIVNNAMWPAMNVLSIVTYEKSNNGCENAQYCPWTVILLFCNHVFDQAMNTLLKGHSAVLNLSVTFTLT